MHVYPTSFPWQPLMCRSGPVGTSFTSGISFLSRPMRCPKLRCPDLRCPDFNLTGHYFNVYTRFLGDKNSVLLEGGVLIKVL